jgi:predicted dehydrogenase
LAAAPSSPKSSPDALPAGQCLAPIGVGLVGGGAIAARYAATLRKAHRFAPVSVAVRAEASRSAASERTGLPAVTLSDMLADQAIELVLNLTPPLEHADITAAALQAGRHVYSEKPLAHDLKSARRLVRLAHQRGRLLACAPATFLGPALQHARRLIDTGVLGRVMGARGVMAYRGPDQWHHAPAALFGPAAGPVFDMGVYHVAALVHLFGPVKQVWAAGSRAFAQRTVRAGPRAGETFPVDAITHADAVLGFVSVASASLTLSFDTQASSAPALEIFGTEAALRLPQPGQFEGPVGLSRSFGVWEDVTPAETWPETGWIAGLHAMADQLERPDPSRPWPEPMLALHVLEVLTGIDRACRTGRIATMTTSCEQPAPLDATQMRHWGAGLKAEAA